MFKFTKLDRKQTYMSLDTLKLRYGYDKLSNWGINQKDYDNTMGDKVNVRGKEQIGYADPLIRIREDKLRSLKRALYNSYQSAVIVFDKDDRELHFRCLMNHDKLKVDYEDKILSIPYKQIPVEYEGLDMELSQKIVDVGTPGRFEDEAGNPVLDQNNEEIYQYRVKPGDTFKWISGNEGYMPDSYWIIFLQYSEQTAYFRGEIRKADDIIEIIPVEEDGTEGDPILYHGWTTGPNEDQAIWNVKKGVIWNDLYYTKLLYITKDETTSAFFERFDRVVINGQTWEVQGYNDNYGTTSKKSSGGMIRVALKETYTSTNQVIKKMQQDELEGLVITGPDNIESFDIVSYTVPDGYQLSWSIDAAAPFKILTSSSKELKIQVLQVNSKITTNISYGNQTKIVTIKPFK